jgi:hypothetical protein
VIIAAVNNCMTHGGKTMFNFETQAQSGINESMMNHFVGSIDLTGAELEFAGCCVNVTSGKLGQFDPKRRQVSGSLSIISPIKPSLLSSVVRIHWRDQAFEVMMISLKETSLQNELKLKFVARLPTCEALVSNPDFD